MILSVLLSFTNLRETKKSRTSPKDRSWHYIIYQTVALCEPLQHSATSPQKRNTLMNNDDDIMDRAALKIYTHQDINRILICDNSCTRESVVTKYANDAALFLQPNLSFTNDDDDEDDDENDDENTSSSYQQLIVNSMNIISADIPVPASTNFKTSMDTHVHVFTSLETRQPEDIHFKFINTLKNFKETGTKVFVYVIGSEVLSDSDDASDDDELSVEMSDAEVNFEVLKSCCKEYNDVIEFFVLARTSDTRSLLSLSTIKKTKAYEGHLWGAGPNAIEIWREEQFIRILQCYAQNQLALLFYKKACDTLNSFLGNMIAADTHNEGNKNYNYYNWERGDVNDLVREEKTAKISEQGRKRLGTAIIEEAKEGDVNKEWNEQLQNWVKPGEVKDNTSLAGYVLKNVVARMECAKEEEVGEEKRGGKRLKIEDEEEKEEALSPESASDPTLATPAPTSTPTPSPAPALKPLQFQSSSKSHSVAQQLEITPRQFEQLKAAKQAYVESSSSQTTQFPTPLITTLDETISEEVGEEKGGGKRLKIEDEEEKEEALSPESASDPTLATPAPTSTPTPSPAPALKPLQFQSSSKSHSVAQQLEITPRQFEQLKAAKQAYVESSSSQTTQFPTPLITTLDETISNIETARQSKIATSKNVSKNGLDNKTLLHVSDEVTTYTFNKKNCDVLEKINNNETELNKLLSVFPDDLPFSVVEKVGNAAPISPPRWLFCLKCSFAKYKRLKNVSSLKVKDLFDPPVVSEREEFKTNNPPTHSLVCSLGSAK